MIKRVIFITYWPFNLRDKVRFDMTPLLNHGIQFEYWDISYIVDKEHAVEYAKSGLQFPDNYFVYKDQHEVFKRLSSLDESSLVMPNISINAFWVYQAITKSSAQYFAIQNQLMPINDKYLESFYEKIFRYLMCIFKYKVFFSRVSYVIRRFFLKLKQNSIKKPLFIVSGGTETISIGDQNNLLLAHAFDYDRYLEIKISKERIIEEKDYIVFIDSYLPFHPDFLISNTSPPCTPEKYYKQLGRFFEKIEAQYNMKVIIACHPVSNYENHPDYFCGRKLVKNNTHKLIRDSRLVLMQASTAINFANLFEKPMLFVNSDEFYIKDKSFAIMIEKLALGHNSKMVCLTDTEDIKIPDNVFEIDKEAYKKYRNAYIKCDDTPEENTWSIIGRYIANL